MLERIGKPRAIDIVDESALAAKRNARLQELGPLPRGTIIFANTETLKVVQRFESGILRCRIVTPDESLDDPRRRRMMQREVDVLLPKYADVKVVAPPEQKTSAVPKRYARYKKRDTDTQG